MVAFEEAISIHGVDTRPLATWWASTARDWCRMGMVRWLEDTQEFLPHIWGWAGVELRAAGKGKGKGRSLKGTPVKGKGQKGHGKVGKGQKGHGKAGKGQKGKAGKGK
jgi:hypothetical protein